MKVTRYGPNGLPLPLAGWSTGATSVNSNFNTVDGGFSATNFVQGITVNGSNMLLRPIANIANGSNIWLSIDSGPGGSLPSNTVRIHSTASGGGSISAGSNSMRVSEDPSAGASTTLWSPFDHRHDGIGTITASSSNTMQRGTFNLRSGTNISFGLTDTDGDGELDTMTINNTAATSSGSSTDPITIMFGTPDTAYEFDSSSLSGLTALGTPDAEAANTTIPGNYYLADNTGTVAWCGRYQAIPSYPFTAICKLTDANMQLNFQGAGLFLSVATPGKMAVLGSANAGAANGRNVTLELFTNPTTFSSTVVGGTPNEMHPPIWFAVVAASTTSTTWYYSFAGYTWTRLQNTYDPSMTIGSVGIAMKSQNTTGFAVAFDYFRIWNSSKTFLTGI